VLCVFVFIGLEEEVEWFLTTVQANQTEAACDLNTTRNNLAYVNLLLLLFCVAIGGCHSHRDPCLLNRIRDRVRRSSICRNKNDLGLRG
jgi:hypothetical protein